MRRKDHVLTLLGGTPLNQHEIAQTDVRAYRTGLRHLFRQIGISSVRSALRLQFRAYSRLNPAEREQLESLPKICVLPKMGLEPVRLYREYSASLFAKNQGNDFSVLNITDAFLTQFPNILDCPDTWVALQNY